MGDSDGDGDDDENKAKDKEEESEEKAEGEGVPNENAEDKPEAPSEKDAEATSQDGSIKEGKSDKNGNEKNTKIVDADKTDSATTSEEKKEGEGEEDDQVTGVNEPIIELEPEQFRARPTATHLSNLTIIDTRTGFMVSELETDLLGAGCCASFSHCGTLLSVIVGDPLSGYHMIVYESPEGTWKDASM